MVKIRKTGNTNGERECNGRHSVKIDIGPCLDAKFPLKFHYAKRRFSITSKCRHMHGVLNIDEIKN
jgi:hypothetical protein